MNKFKYIGLSIIFLGVASIGYALVSALVEKTSVPAIIQKKNLVFQQRGVVKNIGPNIQFIIVEIPTRYSENSLLKEKIYITDQTKIEQGNVLAEEDIIYYEDVPTPSNAPQIEVGDQIIINVLVAGNKLTALYLRHGNPIPGI